MNLITKLRTLGTAKAGPEQELPDVAGSIAIIMDGNGRWARRRKLPVAAGHRAGTKALRRTVEAAIDLGVESVCVFAFSTENWSRPPEEVDALMEIFVETIERELPDLAKQGVATRFIGRRDRANPELQERMARLEEVPAQPATEDEAEALSAQVLEFCAHYRAKGAEISDTLDEQLAKVEDPAILCDIVTHTFVRDPHRRQRVLEETRVADRLRTLIRHLGEEMP